MDDEPELEYAPAYELVRTGLKVALGKRGDAAVEFLDRRRQQRTRERTRLLAREAEAAGLDPDALLERVKSDDDALELFEEIVSVAQSARLDDKIRYLGRCLANALATDDDAAIDATWLRLAAIRDIEAPHVRLLAAIAEGQSQRWWSDGVPEHALVKPDHQEREQPELLTRRSPTLPQLDRATFEPLVASLLRNGVVTTDMTYDLEIFSEVQGKSIDDLEIENQPNIDAIVKYLLTALGREVLTEIQSASKADD